MYLLTTTRISLLHPLCDSTGILEFTMRLFLLALVLANVQQVVMKHSRELAEVSTSASEAINVCIRFNTRGNQCLHKIQHFDFVSIEITRIHIVLSHGQCMDHEEEWRWASDLL